MESNEQSSPKLHCAWTVFAICFLMVGCALGFTPVPVFASTPVVVYNTLGTYNPAMAILCGLMAAVAILMQFVIKAVHTERKKREPEG